MLVLDKAALPEHPPNVPNTVKQGAMRELLVPAVAAFVRDSMGSAPEIMIAMLSISVLALLNVKRMDFYNSNQDLPIYPRRNLDYALVAEALSVP